MGIYSVTESTTELLGDVGIIECSYEHMTEAALNIIAESEYNFGIIMKQVGIEELAVYEATGQEMVYESSNIDGFFSKIKEFFLNIWEKIKGLFKKFFAMIDVYAKTDKEFATKYKKDLFAISHSLKDFKFNGFEFEIATHADMGKVISTVDSAIDKEVGWNMAATPTQAADLEKLKKAKEDMEDVVEKVRGAVAGGGSQTASEFNKELFMLFRKGEDTKQEIDNVDINGMLVELESSADAKKTAEKAMTAIEKVIKDDIKLLDKTRNEIIKAMPDASTDNGKLKQDRLSAAHAQTAFLQAGLGIIQTYNGALLTAIKDRGRQNKAVCASLLSYKPKKENATGWSHESTFLSNVKFK